MTPFTGFLLVLTFRFPLDELLAPYVEVYAPGVLISGTELLTSADVTGRASPSGQWRDGRARSSRAGRLRGMLVTPSG